MLWRPADGSATGDEVADTHEKAHQTRVHAHCPVARHWRRRPPARTVPSRRSPAWLDTQMGPAFPRRDIIQSKDLADHICTTMEMACQVMDGEMIADHPEPHRRCGCRDKARPRNAD